MRESLQPVILRTDLTGKPLSSFRGRLYGFIQGNVTKKELDFESIVKVNFAKG